MESSVAHLGAFILVAATAWTIFQFIQAPAAKVPGPWYTRWTSLVLHFHTINGTRPYYIHELHKRYGPFVRIGPDQVDISDVEAVKTIYGTKNPFQKSLYYRNLVSRGTESTFSTVNVEYHRRHRRLLARPLSDSALRSKINRVQERTKLAIDKIREEMKTRGAADVFKWWIFLATDTIGELTFGDSFHMLELGRKNDYAHELDRVGSVGALRSVFPSLVHLSSIVPLPIFRAAAEAGEKIKGYAKESLARYSRLIAANPTLVKETLFTRMFQAEEEEELPFDEICDEAQSFIVAGSDTTGSTLTYLTWSVCRDPQIKERLVGELQTLPADFAEEHLRDLPFLNKVVAETLRLYSAGQSSLPRSVPPQGAQLGEYWFKGGTVVSAQAHTLHRDPDIYPNPSCFDPERWSNPTRAMKDAYMPFGRGARVCLGQHLALMEIRLATAHFFRSFPEAKISALEGMSEDDMKPVIFFLMSPTGGRCLVQAH